MRPAAAALADAQDLLTGATAGELLAAAAAAAGLRLDHWRLRGVHHRAGRSVSVVYEATIHGAGADPEAAKEVLLVAHADARGLPEDAYVLHRGDLEVAVWRFPHDPYLTGLPSAIHRARVRELLDELGGPEGAVALRTRAYRPSRRAVVEVTVDGPEATGRVLYLKVLTGERAGEVADVHRQLSRVVPVPGVIGVGPRQGIVALEALGGATLRSVLVSGAPLPDPEEVMALADAIAHSGLESSRDPARFADPTRHVELLRGLLPDTEPALSTTAATAQAVAGPVVPVHGDLHDAQILVDDGRVVGLLDVDGAGTGRLAQDLGGLVAHLEVVGDVWPEARGRAEAYAAEVADVARRRVSAVDLACGAAGAWLGLATGAYRAQDPAWQDVTRGRIAQAEAWARAAHR